MADPEALEKAAMDPEIDRVLEILNHAYLIPPDCDEEYVGVARELIDAVRSSSVPSTEITEALRRVRNRIVLVNGERNDKRRGEIVNDTVSLIDGALAALAGVARERALEEADPHARQAEAHRIAEAFHESYERQAGPHGYATREASAVLWAEVPQVNRALMIDVVDELLAEGVIAAAVSPTGTEGKAYRSYLDDREADPRSQAGLCEVIWRAARSFSSPPVEASEERRIIAENLERVAERHGFEGPSWDQVAASIVDDLGSVRVAYRDREDDPTKVGDEASRPNSDGDELGLVWTLSAPGDDGNRTTLHHDYGEGSVRVIEESAFTREHELLLKERDPEHPGSLAYQLRAALSGATDIPQSGPRPVGVGKDSHPGTGTAEQSREHVRDGDHHENVEAGSSPRVHPEAGAAQSAAPVPSERDLAHWLMSKVPTERARILRALDAVSTGKAKLVEKETAAPEPLSLRAAWGAYLAEAVARGFARPRLGDFKAGYKAGRAGVPSSSAAAISTPKENPDA